jgi:LysR family transcriptional regulator, hydrogen peroxide-inducible genes activator
MNLAQLRFASAVASNRSFTAAADQCHVTQPTLSNGIAQLEIELGERLFMRTTRSVSLTAFGQHVMPGINDVIRAEQALILCARSFLKPTTRLIRIGTSPLINASVLGPMLEPFRTRHPDVDIVLREMNMADLYQKLDEGQLDFVFSIKDDQKGRWETAAIYDEPLVYIASGMPAATRRAPEQVRFVDISRELFVMVPDACGLARATRALFRSHRRPLKSYSGEAMGYQVLEQWAGLGIGAAILPLSKLSSSPAMASRIIDKSASEVRLAFEAAWSAHALHTEHLRDFAVHLRCVVPHLAAGLRKNETD